MIKENHVIIVDYHREKIPHCIIDRCRIKPPAGVSILSCHGDFKFPVWSGCADSVDPDRADYLVAEAGLRLS